MRRTNIARLAVFLIGISILTACKHVEVTDQQIKKFDSNSKTLVVYFSQTGTTKQIASYAADTLDADIYEILPKIPYTQEDLNYHDFSTRTTKEQNDPSARPKLLHDIKNLDAYDLILLGYPIWHGQAPRIITTF